jgi:hypothetical protein
VILIFEIDFVLVEALAALVVFSPLSSCFNSNNYITEVVFVFVELFPPVVFFEVYTTPFYGKYFCTFY